MSESADPELYLGMISGTSVDNIDAALVDLSGEQPVLVASHDHPWPAELRDAIFATRVLGDDELDQLDALDTAIADAFADAAMTCLDHAGVAASSVTAIGSHGQTIRHRPDGPAAFSLQLGNAGRIAARTGIDVVADFRSADIDAGGQGAPMGPAFHQAVFQHEQIDRVIVNIGGIGNITVLPADPHSPVTGFDTGPGNNLMDAWIERHRGERYDADGRFAASGRSDVKLLAELLTDPYFELAPPKSTGFELFNLAWLEPHITGDRKPEDVQSTLCDLTATSIVRDIHRYAAATTEIYVCGGGAHNTELMSRLQRLTRAKVDSTDALGVPPDWVEAMTFAWLARQHLKQLPGNIPTVTGARDARVLGRLSTGTGTGRA